VRNGVHILVLNHNGRNLLEECLPSVIASARAAKLPAQVTVIDNASSDDSLDTMRRNWPEIAVRSMPNLGLVSFNEVVRRVNETVVVLLNNDVKLARDAVDRLAEPLRRDPDCFLTGPQCWGFDGLYEGTRSALCFRRGLVHTRLQPPAVVDGITDVAYTASAGAVLAVDRAKFLALGGFDPLFLPGRYEDLDLAFRGWLAGWKAVYVPEALAYHKRSATFHARLGREGVSKLDARNSLLFAWKNLRSTNYLALHLLCLSIRLIWSVFTGQTNFLCGYFSALRKLPAVLARRAAVSARLRSERELFTLLRWQ
jgi:GT2 family glycosyltransferase